MSLFSAKATNSKTPTMILGYRTQTSLYGKAIPIVYGQTRIPGNVIWTGDWRANPVKATGGKGGGGKGSSGKGGAGGQQYTYSSAIAIALAQGPIRGIGYVWVDKIRMTVNRSVLTVTVPGGLIYTVPEAATYVDDYGIGRQSAYSVTANDYGSPGSVTLIGVQSIPLTRVSGAPAPGEYSVDPLTGQYTFNAANAGATVQIGYSWADPNASVDGNPIQDLSFALFTGEQGQAPSGYLVTNHLNQALGYTSLAYVLNENLDLGSSGLVSNYGFEVLGLLPFGANIPDCNPADVIEDFLTDSLRGAGFPLASLGDLDELSTYCRANGIFISEYIDSGRAASAWIEDWLTISNCAAVWSEGLLKFRSYGDKTAVGNGATFVPTTSPVYDLTADDFLADVGEEPIKISRPSVRDAYNSVSVEWLNRGNNYIPEPVEEKDSWAIQQFGLRPDSPRQLHAITSQQVAQKVGNTIVNRLVYIRNSYRFKLSAVKYALLEPMDMVTLNKEENGLDRTPVRLTSIEEDDKLQLSCTAEEFPWGTATPTTNPKQSIGPFGPGYFANPGPVNIPFFFEATAQMTQEILYTLLIGLSGGRNWGGANVHVSTDAGSSYKFIGTQTGPARMGVLTAALPAASDPDNTNTLKVDLTESLGALSSYTEAQENSFIPLVAIDDELIAYRTATLTASFRYDITHLRRGVFGSILNDHKTGAKFAFVDESLFEWIYEQVNIGKTLLFKFTSFNTAGQMEENIANVPAYSYSIRGPRFAYPWNTAGARVSLNQAWRKSNFGIQQSFQQQTDGSQKAVFKISGEAVTNSFSKITQPPGLSLTTSATGGTIPGGVTATVGIWAIDSVTSSWTRMTVETIVIPSGTNTNKIDGAFTKFLAGDSVIVAISLAPDTGWHGNITTGASTFSITAIDDDFILVPDERYNEFYMQATEAVHSGIWANAIGTITHGGGFCTMTFVGSTWGVNQLQGKILSLLFAHDFRALPMMDVAITSNTADTITIPDQTGALLVHLQVNDVVVVRTKPTVITANSIKDPDWVNGGNGQPGTGLTPSAEKGNLLWVINGPGAGQPAILIDDNDADTIYLASDFVTLPDSTSSFIIVKQGWQFNQESLKYVTETQGLSTPIVTVDFFVDNTEPKTFVVQVLSVDPDGNRSLIPYSPFREIYQPGKAGNLNIMLQIARA